MGELIDDRAKAYAYMMDLRENTSCETDLDCDAVYRRGRGGRLMYYTYSFTHAPVFF